MAFDYDKYIRPGKLPHIWEFTFLFRANTSIGVNITGTYGAPMTIRLIFSGMKIHIGSRPALGL